MASFRRIPALVLTMALVLVPALLSGAAGAATADDLAAAKAKLAEARASAQSAAAAFADQESKVAATQNHIDELRDAIEKQKARAAVLKEIATERALYAYTHKGEDVGILVGNGDAVKAIRQTQLMEQANQTDSNAIRRLAAINADLKVQQNELEQEEKQQAQVAASLDAKNRSLQSALADVQSATNALQAKYDAEIAAANAATRAAPARGGEGRTAGRATGELVAVAVAVVAVAVGSAGRSCRVRSSTGSAAPCRARRTPTTSAARAGTAASTCSCPSARRSSR